MSPYLQALFAAATVILVAPIVAPATAGIAAAVAAAGASSGAAAIEAPQAGACVVAAGGRTFDLSELGGGGDVGTAPPLRHVSQRPDSRGWIYTFAACGDLTPPPAACAHVQHSAVLQEAGGPCFSLGASATRTATATDKGLAISFSGGDGGRSTVVSIECADVSRPQVVHWGHGAAPSTYAALVLARAGCALECARDSAGAVCGGAVRGVCVAEMGGAGGSAQCSCVTGWAGEACAHAGLLQAAEVLPNLPFENPCLFSAPNGVIYNLSAVTQFSITWKGFSYTFVLCGTRRQEQNDQLFHCLGSASAVQVQLGTSNCHRIGASFLTSEFAVEPSAPGITLRYHAGDSCDKIFRTFSATIECADDLEVEISEPETCQYELFVRGPAGCPIQCPRSSDGRICGGKTRGECMLDGTCACQPSHAGANCEHLTTSNLPRLPSSLSQVKTVQKLGPASFDGLASSGTLCLCLFIMSVVSVSRMSMFARPAIVLTFATFCFALFFTFELPYQALVVSFDQCSRRKLSSEVEVHDSPWIGFALGKWEKTEEDGIFSWTAQQSSSIVDQKPVDILLMGDSVDRQVVEAACASTQTKEWAPRSLIPYLADVGGTLMCTLPEISMSSLHLFGAAHHGPYLHGRGGELEDTWPRIARALEHYKLNMGHAPTHIVYQSGLWDAAILDAKRIGPAFLTEFTAAVNRTLAQLLVLAPPPHSSVFVRTTPTDRPTIVAYNSGLRRAAAINHVPVIDWALLTEPLTINHNSFFRDRTHPSVHYCRQFADILIAIARHPFS